MVLLRRISLYLALFILLVMSLIWLFSPLAVRLVAAKPLAEYGLQVDRGSSVRLNLFNSTLTVRNFQLSSKTEGVVALESLDIEYSLWRLLVKQIRVHSIELDGLSVLAENTAAGINLVGMEFPVADPDFATDVDIETEASALPSAQEKTQAKPFGFSISIPTVQLANLSLALANQGQTHELNIGQLNIDDTRFSQPELNSLNLSTALQLKKLSITEQTRGDVLFSLAGFDSGDVELTLQDDAFNLTTNQLLLQEILASQRMAETENPALAQLASIAVNDVNVNPEKISIADIEIGGGDVAVLIDEAGELLTLVELPAAAEQSNEQANAQPDEQTLSIDQPENLAEAAEPSPPTLHIGKIELTKPIAFLIDDRSNSHAFNKRFELHQFALTDIDNSQAELPATLALALKDEDYFTLKTEGTLKPFLAKPAIDLVTEVREFPLNEVAPYLKDTLGFEVLSGQLDADINAKVASDELDSKVVLFLRGANFASSDKPDERNLIGKAAIPLNVALNMLKDGDGNIELKIPVKGDVTDPSFGVNHVIGIVVKKIVLAQAKDYLMTTFVPYAKVVSVALAAGEQALKIRLEDLPYQPNQLALQAEQIEFVEQLGQLMIDKPGIVVNVCGVARADEVIAAKPAKGEVKATAALSASAISIERARLFKSYIVENFSIESSRLLTCSDQVDEKEKAKPRIEFKVL